MPNVRSAMDTQNFDEEFTQEVPRETIIESSELAKLEGQQDPFNKFSFVAESN